MNTLAPLFLIGSPSYLKVTRTTIISRTTSNLGQIRPRTAELAALERLEQVAQRATIAHLRANKSSKYFE